MDSVVASFQYRDFIVIVTKFGKIYKMTYDEFSGTFNYHLIEKLELKL